MINYLQYTEQEVEMADTAYCVKEKKVREMTNVQRVTMKNGRPALKGNCSVCGTGMYKILSKEASNQT